MEPFSPPLKPIIHVSAAPCLFIFSSALEKNGHLACHAKTKHQNTIVQTQKCIGEQAMHYVHTAISLRSPLYRICCRIRSQNVLLAWSPLRNRPCPCRGLDLPIRLFPEMRKSGRPLPLLFRFLQERTGQVLFILEVPLGW